MYVNSEKYVVMAKVLEGGIYHHYFVGKRSHIDNEDCVPDMVDNIDDALIFTDMYEVFDVVYKLPLEWWQLCWVYRVEYDFKEVWM